MRPILLLATLIAAPTLTACSGSTGSALEARIEALEAKSHSQAKKIDDLTKKVAAISTSAGSDRSPEPTP